MLSMIRRPVQLALLFGSLACAVASADGPDDAVHWTASVTAPATIKRGTTATLDVSGEVQAGWHVYGLEQEPRGPTPLRVTLDPNAIVTAAGPATGTAPETVHDTHFGFDTQLYTHPFSVHLPVQLDGKLDAGRQVIPVSVRFQACSDRECLLPRTVHLSVAVEVEQ